MNNAGKQDSKPWYREPWPWLLMMGPLAVVVASLVSAWIAIRTDDGLVSEDYYKQGLRAGETVVRSRQAELLGLQASISLKVDGIRVRLSSSGEMIPPPALRVMLSHPTRAGLDQQSRLRQDGDTYVGELHLPASGHWLVLIEDEAQTWRLMGGIVLPSAKEAVIGAPVATPPAGG